eukprot:CAMPEP_0198122780 /NCGR_PEP_ID=MMETSP1442-20131203/35798_1 /TAXON_ID= /ORGANISM="Craspedostauros australis, Strain CCMP3328" /LENGTH=67 /DNA_ID=CAMNT_0043781863 /DNA_START=391 /DNA_END=590 /DNA_ORIENTATION=-
MGDTTLQVGQRMDWASITHRSDVLQSRHVAGQYCPVDTASQVSFAPRSSIQIPGAISTSTGLFGASA